MPKNALFLLKNCKNRPALGARYSSFEREKLHFLGRFNRKVTMSQ